MDISANIEILNFFNNFSNPLANLAYCNDITIYPSYFPDDEDSLTILAQLYNPEEHITQVFAHIEADNSGYKDSLELQKRDTQVENLWHGKKLMSNLEKDFYKVSIKTTDSEENLSNFSPFFGHFTNINLEVSDSIELFFYS